MRRIVPLSLLVLAALAPGPAHAQKPADVTRVESAVTELAKQKRAAEGQVSSHRRAAQNALGACRTSGKGWGRIRGVRDRAQRNAYAKVAAEGAWVEVYSPAFERFLRHFDAPLADPVLQAGVGAQRRPHLQPGRLLVRDCASFNAQLKRVREFKVGGDHGVSGDYYAGKIYNGFVRYVADRQRAAARAHWGSRDDNALEAARDQLKALGGDEGYANYFAFAFKG